MGSPIGAKQSSMANQEAYTHIQEEGMGINPNMPLHRSGNKSFKTQEQPNATPFNHSNTRDTPLIMN